MKNKSKLTRLSFELINDDKLIEFFKPAFIPKARYYFIFVGFGIGIILSLLTILIEDVINGDPIFSALNELTKIHQIATPVFLGILGVFAGMIYDKYSKRQKLIFNAFFESQQTLKLITDNLPSLISYITPDLHYLFTNKTYSDWLKISPHEIYGKHVREILGEKAFKEVLPYINKALSGQPVSFEGMRFYREHTKQYVKTTLVPHIDNESKVIGVFVLTTDITELKKRENRIKKQKRQLQKINVTKDKLFSVIAHDLKSPFNAILGFSQLLSEEIETFSKQEIIEISKLLNQQSKDTYNLLNNILDWARTQLKGIQPSPEVIGLKKLMNDVLDFVDDNAQQKKIELVSDVNQNITAFADRNLLESVFRNLLTNALKFTPEGGKINIHSKETKQGVELSVSDTGIGMTQEQLKLLFQTNTENKSTRGTNNEQGTGLGLIICKEFVEKNGGKIKVTSTIGEGTTFTINLPDSSRNPVK